MIGDVMPSAASSRGRYIDAASPPSPERTILASHGLAASVSQEVLEPPGGVVRMGGCERECEGACRAYHSDPGSGPGPRPRPGRGAARPRRGVRASARQLLRQPPRAGARLGRPRRRPLHPRRGGDPDLPAARRGRPGAPGPQARRGRAPARAHCRRPPGDAAAAARREDHAPDGSRRAAHDARRAAAVGADRWARAGRVARRDVRRSRRLENDHSPARAWNRRARERARERPDGGAAPLPLRAPEQPGGHPRRPSRRRARHRHLDSA